MPIYQTNVFVCEVCGLIESVTESYDMHYDPVITPPSDGWNYTEKEDKLACPNCMKKDSE